MQILVFVTEDEAGQSTGPTLFLRDRPNAVLPVHPRALAWKYFATIEDRDDMLAHMPGAVEVIEQQGHYIANRMI